MFPHVIIFTIRETISNGEKKATAMNLKASNVFFSVWVFFHEHSRFTGKQGKGKAISLTSLYHLQTGSQTFRYHPMNTAESSPLHIASSRTRTGNLSFPSTSR